MVDRRTRPRGPRRTVIDPSDVGSSSRAAPATDGEGTPSGTHGDAEHTDRLDDARRELEGAAVDLERVTELLHERSEAVDALEVLVDHLLELVDVPLVVVDADGRIAAVSRGAAATVGALADALGKPARAVLPSGALAEASPEAEGPARSHVVALPRGSTLVRLDA
jgi:PAS domain-containing protein